MEEDDFLVEAAKWARYYERVQEVIQQITASQISDVPPQEIIDDPASFKNWVEQCKKVYDGGNR